MAWIDDDVLPSWNRVPAGQLRTSDQWTEQRCPGQPSTLAIGLPEAVVGVRDAQPHALESAGA